MRIGFGYDVHAFAEGRELRLGGVRIDYPLGLAGHSDADVLIHAICDALLGAAAFRDIGYHFPDTSPDYQGVDSKILMQRVVAMLRENGFEPGNIDCTIVAEQPRLSSYIPEMQRVIAETMNIPETDVSVKATTTEHLGFTGRKEGIAAYAVALIKAKRF
ncbi:MAG: 2-C-methyl-D-erythritol 2,4-cyclodiphosphate synthase [Tannerella sp.]|jgi:2-C-methyl-D-erythritol 2,4-cyclodiphosphate synthase|nr:2-C-methyl-D-erythritol 2,4-cyclodiphosphate synthase [Tannerella sp.]